MIEQIKRWLLGLACLGIIGVIAIGSWMVYYSSKPLRSITTPVQFNLAKGSSLRGVANQLVTAGILDEPWSFIVLARVRGKSGQIKAGNYELLGEITPNAVLVKITGNDYAQESIVFVEGWTFKQIRISLGKNKSLKHQTTAMSDTEILKAIGADEPSAEGLFFPDTYFFTAGASDLTVLERAYRLMQSHLRAAWDNKAPDLPFSTPYEALIASSIVEKETGDASERSMIAGVIVNRLKMDMKLQVDPTVIYGMGDNFDGNLRKQDLSFDHPYNTYTRTGLPPTPIAVPGRAAIAATLNPAQTKALYYVSRGDGTSQFSATLAEHNRAVAKYQKRGKS